MLQCDKIKKKEKLNISLFSAYICEWRWNIAWRVEILNIAVFIVLIMNFWSRICIICDTFCLEKFPQSPTEKTQNIARFIKQDYCFPRRPFHVLFFSDSWSSLWNSKAGWLNSLNIGTNINSNEFICVSVVDNFISVTKDAQYHAEGKRKA